eukprot:TRINITY_DN69106_c0_g1_i1.p1 TRINITY_DN69106_c0_g1~~TRINITY_DN69106_c0_g1_i1.p1  ORF type:complete len:208 (-),score=14.11 TRINITY_DN69106_c0_g1_i1:343-966(-)
MFEFIKEYDSTQSETAIQILSSREQFVAYPNQLPQLLQVLATSKNPNAQTVKQLVIQCKEELPKATYSLKEVCQLLSSLATLRVIHKDEDIISVIMQQISMGYDQLKPEELSMVAQVCSNMEINLINQVSFQLAVMQCDLSDLDVDSVVLFVQHLFVLEVLNESIWGKAVEIIKGQLLGKTTEGILQDIVMQARLKGITFIQLPDSS